MKVRNRGVWNDKTAYQAGDLFEKDGYTYVATTNGPSRSWASTPKLTYSEWLRRYAMPGEDGTAGPIGPQGPQGDLYNGYDFGTFETVYTTPFTGSSHILAACGLENR